jgi:hypothetical protein
VLEEVGEGLDALPRGRRIEDDLNDPKKGVVLDDEDGTTA